jgi:hypothetical protein
MLHETRGQNIVNAGSKNRFGSLQQISEMIPPGCTAGLLRLCDSGGQQTTRGNTGTFDKSSTRLFFVHTASVLWVPQNAR